MMESKKYSGGCHCGRVSFDAEVDLSKTMTCNCSHCSKRGFILSFIPPSQFALKSGGDDLVEYKFNKHVISHLFCPICGVHSFARGTMPSGEPVVAVNVRCLDGVDIASLNPAAVDGRSF